MPRTIFLEWFKVERVHSITDDELGSLSVKVIASDKQFSASSTFALSVTNARVELSKELISQTSTVANGFRYQFAADSFKDADDTLTYSVRLKDGRALPAWLSFDSATRTSTGTPTRDDLGGVLPLYNVGYIAAGTPKSLTFSQN